MALRKPDAGLELADAQDDKRRRRPGLWDLAMRKSARSLRLPSTLSTGAVSIAEQTRGAGAETAIGVERLPDWGLGRSGGWRLRLAISSVSHAGAPLRLRVGS